MEPIWTLGTYNPLLAQFTAAWFKVYLNKTPKDKVSTKQSQKVWHLVMCDVYYAVHAPTHLQGTDFEEMLFGKTKDSLCGGGDGKMTKCELHQ